ncbi:hypothetical protein [Catenuloplanes indicus]|uniref:Uncharacterized protein n=1 Tax=Catenuloplanes indicus TaxID=137267 RepID=A0AAE3VWR1_9ACTN|nr:hypothetical protein [Catenuloplanes indicus]MDQ0364649.1 hypothetical protein [Catenuloplanes indicus]
MPGAFRIDLKECVVIGQRHPLPTHDGIRHPPQLVVDPDDQFPDLVPVPHRQDPGVTLDPRICDPPRQQPPVHRPRSRAAAPPLGATATMFIMPIMSPDGAFARLVAQQATSDGPGATAARDPLLGPACCPDCTTRGWVTG